MPREPIPAQIVELLSRPNPAVLACIRPDGTPHQSAIWYGWQGGRILLTFDRERVRLRFIRKNPNVSVCVLDSGDWFRHVVLFGRVVEIFDDEGLANVDGLSHSYMGKPYPDRTRPRVCAWMEIDSWFAWNAYAEVANLEDGGTQVGATAS